MCTCGRYFHAAQSVYNACSGLRTNSSFLLLHPLDFKKSIILYNTLLTTPQSIKSAVFLLYQYLTTHKDRFRRFASLKANFILDTLDCLLWFTAFIISCMGGKRCMGSSCALLGVAATVALFLASTYFITAIGIDWPKWRASKKLPQMEQV